MLLYILREIKSNFFKLGTFFLNLFFKVGMRIYKPVGRKYKYGAYSFWPAIDSSLLKMVETNYSIVKKIAN